MGSKPGREQRADLLRKAQGCLGTRFQGGYPRRQGRTQGRQGVGHKLVVLRA